MAASNTDKLRKGYQSFSTTLASTKASGASTMSLSSATGIPTTTGIDFTVGRVDSSGTATPSTKVVYTGTLSGTTVSNLTVKEGSDQSHSAGTVVEITFTASMWNDHVDHLLTEHNQDGTHKPTVIYDSNGNEELKFTSTSSAVNEVTIANAATGNAPSISASGSDSAAHLNLRGKGLAKTVTIGAGAATIFPYDYVVSGCVLSGTGYGSTLAWSMTSGVVVINGNPITVASASGTVTASKDTYFDVLDNGDGTGLLVNTGGNIVANNAASPALASNSIRIGIIVSGASNIAAATSVNQGQETMVLPIASSVPYAVTDSLGNLICPRDPNRKVLGYRQISAGATTTSTSVTAITGLSVPVIIPSNRKVVVSFYIPHAYNTTSTARAEFEIWDGTVGSGTRVASAWAGGNNSFSAFFCEAKAQLTPSASSKTYNAGWFANNTGTATIDAAATYPCYIKVELV